MDKFIKVGGNWINPNQVVMVSDDGETLIIILTSTSIDRVGEIYQATNNELTVDGEDAIALRHYLDTVISDDVLAIYQKHQVTQAAKKGGKPTNAAIKQAVDDLFSPVPKNWV